MSRRPQMLILLAAGALALTGTACRAQDGPGGGGSDPPSRPRLSGAIAIDGSRTVFRFAQAAAQQFMEQNPDVRITVSAAGDDAGFARLCGGQTQIADASRPIRGHESAVCRRQRVSYRRVQVAEDAVAVTTNRALPVDCMTTRELGRLWRKGSKVTNYAQLDVRLPNQRVSLFGPGSDSEAFAFFTEEINGRAGDSRTDYQPSDDESLLVQAVSGDKGALGYFSFPSFAENPDKLRLVAVNAGRGCVRPSVETIQSGDYRPLGRPLLMYPGAAALKRPEVRAFMDFVVSRHRDIAAAAHTVPMSDRRASRSRRALRHR